MWGRGAERERSEWEEGEQRERSGGMVGEKREGELFNRERVKLR